MALSTYFGGDPMFGQLERAMDRAFERALGGRGGDVMAAFMPTLTGPSGAGGHPMDIIETKDAFELHTDAPGFTPDDISVQMHEGVLTISGNRKEERVEKDGDKVVRRERHFSQFSRSFTLPDNVKEEGISASLDKGVLRVSVPKTEPAPKPEPKRITVTGA
ncbi:Heat shock 22 kDa protein [Scenedesmus sp. PABB004]|nr:Heat shock 22 kDa protein [Scenedesmus sp. PABB004]